METTTLYRPIGQKELDLIAETDFTAFPPRLFWQPIFYPVLNEEYAIAIARDWNTKDAENGSVGYVTRFAVDAEYLARYPVQCVGARENVELWVPPRTFPSSTAISSGKSRSSMSSAEATKALKQVPETSILQT